MRNNNFDFLRFYFAFVVLLTHLVLVSGIDLFRPGLKVLNSYTSVTAFFIISGYLISMSYKYSVSLKDYFRKRANRLLPAYLFLILASFIGFSFISNIGILNYFTDINTYKYLISNLTFQNYLQPWLPGVFTENCDNNVINGSLWTLKIEIAFYLLLPLFWKLINNSRIKFIPIIIIYVLSVIYKYVFSLMGADFNSGILTILAHQLPGFMSYFVCGIAFTFYKDEFLKRKIILTIIAIAIFWMENKLNIEILTPAALSVIVFTIAFSFKKLNNFAKYGDISYGIYIYHFPLIKIGVVFGLFKYLNPFLAASIIILTVLTVSFGSWHILEKRFLKRVRAV